MGSRHPCDVLVALVVGALLLQGDLCRGSNQHLGRHLKPGLRTHGRELQQLASPLLGLTAELGDTLAGNLKATVGNAYLGLLQDGIATLPGPFRDIASTTLSIFGLGGGGAGLTASEVQDIVNQAADRIISTVTSQVNAQTTALFTEKELRDAVAALATYQDVLQTYRSTLRGRSVQKRLDDIGRPSSNAKTLVTDLLSMQSKLDSLMNSIPSTTVDALPLWMAAQTCYVNYLVEFATLMSTNLADEKPDYAGRQDLWNLVLTRVANGQISVVDRLIKAQLIGATETVYQINDNRLAFGVPSIMDTWTNVAQAVLDSGYFAIDATNGLPANGKAPQHLFKLYSNRLSNVNGALSAVFWRGTKQQGAAQSTEDVLGCMNLCNVAPGCRGFEYVYSLKKYSPFYAPQAAPAFYQKACFIDAGAQLVDRTPQLNYTKIVVRDQFRPDQTSLTFNRSLVKEVLSHPEVAAPGSVTYVAPTVPNTIDATDKFLFAEWPARAGTKDLDANTAYSFGNQAFPASDATACVNMCKEKRCKDIKLCVGNDVCQIAYWDAGLQLCFIGTMNTNVGLWADSFASVSGVKASGTRFTYNLTALAAWK